MTQSLIISIRPLAQINMGAIKEATKRTRPMLYVAFHFHNIPWLGVFLRSLSCYFPYHFDVQRLIYHIGNTQGILLPSHRALPWQQPLLSRPEGWRRMSWDRLPAGSTAFEPAPFVSVFLSQVKDASWKTQASCDNTLSNLYSTKPFRAGKVHWGSNWLIRSLALSTASVQTQHGEIQPGAVRNCWAAPCTEAGHSDTEPAKGCSDIPHWVCSASERSRLGHRDKHLLQQPGAICCEVLLFKQLLLQAHKAAGYLAGYRA